MQNKVQYKSNRGRRVGFVILLVTFTVSLLMSGYGPADTAFASEKVIRFGAPISLTGIYTRPGATVKNGYDLWMEIANEKGGINVNGEYYKIEIKYYDDKSETNAAVKLTEKLITDDGIKFLLAPFGSGPAFACSNVAEKYRLPMVAGQSSSYSVFNRGYKYIFGIMVDTRYYQKPAFELAASLGAKTVAVVYENMIWGIDTAQACKSHAKKQGLEVLFYDKFDSKSMDLSSILLQINAKKPDFLAVNTYLRQGTLLARQMKDLKISVPLISYGYGPVELSWRKNVKDAGMYMVSDSQFDPENTTNKGRIIGTPAEFSRRYNEKYGYVPGHGEANAAGCGVAFQLAIEKAGSLDPQKVRDALASLDEPTFVGRLAFDTDGSRLYAPQYAVQIQDQDINEKPFIVFPTDAAKRKAIYPALPWDQR